MIRALIARAVRVRVLVPFVLAAAFSTSSLMTDASPARADADPVLAAQMVPYAALLRTINPHLAVAQSAAYAQTLLEAAKRFHLDPNLVVALVTVESSWRPSVSSIHGARGLGQLLPGTARDLGVRDSFSGRDNLRGTARYLHSLLGTFHGNRDPIRAALAGYNAGPAAVAANGGAAPNYESRHYVVKVLGALAMIRARVAGLMPHDGLGDADSGLLDDASFGATPTADQLSSAIKAINAEQTGYWGASADSAAGPAMATDSTNL